MGIICMDQVGVDIRISDKLRPLLLAALSGQILAGVFIGRKNGRSGSQLGTEVGDGGPFFADAAGQVFVAQAEFFDQPLVGEGDFHRVQFTPDLLPADLTGTEVFRPQDGSFRFDRGPVFHNLLLADEVNRAPAKVQSALLEAMEERQISVGDKTYPLEGLFMVMATQNPIEQEGTYPLPEAQLDRFLLHVQVGYPSVADERRILVLNRDEAKAGARDAFQPPELLTTESVMQARMDILNLHLAPELEEYIINVVVATRNPGAIDSGGLLEIPVALRIQRFG